MSAGFVVATLGSLAAAVYRGQVSVPPDVPAEGAVAARGSLPGAVTTADSLPGPLAEQLLATASDAFTSGLHLAAVIGAVAFALLAVLASVMVRHLRPYGEEQGVSVADQPSDAAGTSAPTRRGTQRRRSSGLTTWTAWSE